MKGSNDPLYGEFCLEETVFENYVFCHGRLSIASSRDLRLTELKAIIGIGQSLTQADRSDTSDRSRQPLLTPTDTAADSLGSERERVILHW